MKTYAVQPFHFPTTVAFVDDSQQFLSNLSLQLDSRLAYRLHHSPFSALVALNGANLEPPVVGRFFSLYRHRGDKSVSRHVIDVSLDMIHREVHNEHRFEQVSVVVVDYDMPEIDGLEFCRNLKNKAIKKIPAGLRADAAVLNTRPQRSARRCFDVRYTRCPRVCAQMSRYSTPDASRLRSDVAVLNARRHRSVVRCCGTQCQTPAVCDQMPRYSAPDARGLRADAAVLNARCPRSPVRYWRPAPVPPVPRHRGPGQRSAGKFAED